MNRRRFFSLSFAAVVAAVVAPWTAIKAWSATRQTMTMNKSTDWSKPDCMGMFADPDVSSSRGCSKPYSFHFRPVGRIEHEVWSSDGGAA